MLNIRPLKTKEKIKILKMEKVVHKLGNDSNSYAKFQIVPTILSTSFCCEHIALQTDKRMDGWTDGQKIVPIFCRQGQLRFSNLLE